MLERFWVAWSVVCKLGGGLALMGLADLMWSRYGAVKLLYMSPERWICSANTRTLPSIALGVPLKSALVSHLGDGVVRLRHDP